MENLRHVIGRVSDGKSIFLNALDCQGFDALDHESAANVHKDLVKRYGALIEAAFEFEDLHKIPYYRGAQEYHSANAVLHKAAATLYRLNETMRGLKDQGLMVE